MTIRYDLDGIGVVIERLTLLMAQCQVIAFTGTLGAGKTTLISALLKDLGVEELVTSPTFNYVNRYQLKDGRIVYHFDLYRIKTLQDFVAAGFDEYLYAPESVSLIEWPQVVMPLLDRSVCHVTLDYDSHNFRTFTCQCIE